MIFDKSIEQIAETQLLNALYRMSRADPFTASTMIHKLYADSTGSFQAFIMKTLRDWSKSGKIIEHASGQMQIYVHSKGRYGRNNRPTNLYKFKRVSDAA